MNAHYEICSAMNDIIEGIVLSVHLIKGPWFSYIFKTKSSRAILLEMKIECITLKQVKLRLLNTQKMDTKLLYYTEVRISTAIDVDSQVII